MASVDHSTGGDFPLFLYNNKVAALYRKLGVLLPVLPRSASWMTSLMLFGMDSEMIRDLVDHEEPISSTVRIKVG